MDRMIRLRVMMIISYLALLFGYYVKKKHRGSYAYFVESGNCLFSSSTKWVIDSGASDHMTDLKIKKVIGRGRKCDGLYVFESEVSKSLVGLSSSSPFEAHCRLGHPSLQSLKKLCLEYSHLSSLSCDSCEFAKHQRVHLSPRANKRAASPFELVHSDVWGPCPVTSKFGFKPAQNGVAECKNRHLHKVAHALLFQMTVPKPFWADAVSTACFLINCMPSAVLGRNYLYSVLFPTKPLFPIDPKIFDITCFVQDTQPSITKLDPKSLKCVFLGYSRIQKGYRCYSPQLHRYLVSRDVTFHEDLPYFPVTTYLHQKENDDMLVYESHTPVATTKQSAEPDGLPLKAYSDSDAPSDAPSGSDSPPTSPGSSDVSSDASGESDSPSASLAPKLDLPIALQKDSILVLKTVGKALPHYGWRVAMIEEMNALDHNGTWALVDLPIHKKSIGYKWVFSVKMNPDGSIARLKASLVANVYAQTYDIDYFKTFSPVAKIRLFISLATTYDWALHQLDVKNAFLHGDLQEEVYMEQPPRFVAQEESGRVCKLKKALYGLKQSMCCILLVVYVDDIVITGSDKARIKKLKSFIGTCFQMKDLGSLKYFLGIELSRSCKGICLSQRKYCLDLLDDEGQIEAKPCDEPMIPKLKLKSEDGRLL
ncbi:retrovirus-related pol polyprotein from transposon TNT 1-94 [Tanacetum coccineum]